MPAVSKKQQRFFGIVRAIQKGEQKPTTPETAKAASGMKMKSVKKFAKTKHKGLPEKKKMKEESCGKGMYYCNTDQKCKPIPKGTKVRKDGMLVKESPDKLSDLLKGDKEYDLTNARERMIYNRLKKAGKNPLIKKVDESIKDELLSRANEKRKTYKQFRKDARMRGQKPLKRGEVRKYDKETGKWVSNK